jgi:hypothetical protein
MKSFMQWTAHHSTVLAVLVISAAAVAQAQAKTACPSGVDPKASTPFTKSADSTACSPAMSHGHPLPDAACTPGAINPTVTLKVLKSKTFTTGCERDVASSVAQKQTTYGAYHIQKPGQNSGQNQVCELDHLVSLELGGADTVDNIWPQCGPDAATLKNRYFKIKDGVENYLATKVKAGSISLKDAQQGISKDWTVYIDDAQAYWSTHTARGFGLDE